MDSEKKCKIKWVRALRGRLQKKDKIKRVGTLRGRRREDCEKRCKNKRIGH